MEPVRVDMWSDVACPWCLLGGAHLREASRRAGIPVEVEMHAFQLSPDQKDVEPVRDHLARNYSDPARIAASQDRLRAMGAAVGLDYDFEHALAANTFDAHRLHHFAKQQGLGAEVMEGLLRAQHTEGKDVSDPATLLAVAVGAGLDADPVQALLDSDDFAGSVWADIEEAHRSGVQGVPFFVLDRRLALSGAQPVEVFEQALRQASATPSPH